MLIHLILPYKSGIILLESIWYAFTIKNQNYKYDYKKVMNLNKCECKYKVFSSFENINYSR